MLLKATVQRVVDSTVLLNIAGRLISARTEVPLQPRQTVLLEVKQANPLQLSMRLVSQTGEPDRASRPGVPNLQSLLTSWGLSTDDANLTIARSLFARTQTLTPQDIQTVRSLWQQLPPSLTTDTSRRTANLNALAYLYANRLPVSEESLALARRWLTTPLDNGDHIARELSHLQQAMSRIYPHLQTIADQHPALSRLSTILEFALTQMSNWTISADTPAAEIAARLAALLPDLGTPPEAALTALPDASPRVPASPAEPRAAPLTNTPSDGSTSGSAPARGPAEAATPAAKPAALPQPGNPAPHANRLAPNPLHRLAAVIHQALKQAGLDEATPQHSQVVYALKELAGQADSLSKDLSAVHLSNLTNPPAPTAESFYLFPIPLQTADGPRTAHLKVYRRAGRRAIDPQNVRLALLLDLPELGEIAINLTVFEKHLTGQVLSGREQTHRRVVDALQELQHNLSNLGYRVDSLTCDLLTGVENRPSPAGPEADESGPSLSTINLRA